MRHLIPCTVTSIISFPNADRYADPLDEALGGLVPGTLPEVPPGRGRWRNIVRFLQA